MDYALIGLALILLIIIVTHLVNDKTLKLPTDILLVGVAFIIGLVARILCTTIFTGNEFYEYFLNFDFNTFLMDGILCFLVFVGSSKINFNKFVHNIKNITILSILTTVFTTFIYGGLFYLLNLCLSLNFTIWMCFILGAVIAPTDPIAATSILNKIGLSKNVTSIFEGESLFNDGVGIALFLCFKGMVENS